MEAYPSPTADMNVPKKANIKIEPKLRKNKSYHVGQQQLVNEDWMADLLEFIARIQNDWREEEIEEERVMKCLETRQ